MTRVCLVGDEDVNLRYELLSRETSRNALQTYDLRAPYENTVGLETVSLGAAISLLNDLNWYIVRFVDEALVLEPSVSEAEWLTRDLAAAIRDDDIAPADTGRLLKVYGVERPGEVDSANPDAARDASNGEDTGEDADDTAGAAAKQASAAPATQEGTLPRLVEPMLVSRTDDRIPEYDIRDVDDTLVVRLTEAEFENQ
jgi:hypothetical protein